MRSNILFILIFLILCVTCIADDGQGHVKLPAIETFIAEPTVIENISIWVPAVRSGPFINRACKIQENQTFSFVLPASVKHKKTESCPAHLARILAELTSFYYSQSLPLTIFNGWQWEYTNNICQYESISYDLAKRGGCWENSWETILNQSCGISRLKKLNIESLEKFNVQQIVPCESTIEVKIFSSTRTRNGYPKKRQL